jgi:hypothetical protein
MEYLMVHDAQYWREEARAVLVLMCWRVPKYSRIHEFEGSRVPDGTDFESDVCRRGMEERCLGLQYLGAKTQCGI